MDIDLSEYMDAYVDGCRENLDMMDKMLLALEQNPTETAGVNDIFRAAHTLKGMSATMGFEKIAHFTHEMENILDKIRNNTMVVTPEVIDVLFESFDVLRTLVNDSIDATESDVNVDGTVAKLHALADGGSVAESVPAPSPAQPSPEVNSSPASIPEPQPVSEPVTASASMSEEEASMENDIRAMNDLAEMELSDAEMASLGEISLSGNNTAVLTITLVQDCLLKSGRVFMIRRAIEEEEGGTILKALPSFEDLEEEKFDTSFKLLVYTKGNLKALSEELAKVSEVESVVFSDLKNALGEIMGDSVPIPSAAPAPISSPASAPVSAAQPVVSSPAVTPVIQQPVASTPTPVSAPNPQVAPVPQATVPPQPQFQPQFQTQQPVYPNQAPPQQPMYGAPGMSQQQQPMYGMPQQPMYGMPGMWQQPMYGMPGMWQQPMYGMPQQPMYGAPGMSQQPMYGMPQQPMYGMPGMSQQPIPPQVTQPEHDDKREDTKPTNEALIINPAVANNSSNKTKTEDEESEESEKEAVELIQFVTFTMAGEVYAFEIQNVETIINVVPITRVPKAPKHIDGVINLRGEVIPVINTKRRLRLKETPSNSTDQIIILTFDEEKVKVGFLVDSVKEVTSLAETSIEPPNRVSESVDIEYLRGVGKVGSDIIILLNAHRIVFDKPKDANK